MKVYGDRFFAGLRLIDENGVNIVKVNFYPRAGDWFIKDIPEGKEVIGLYCNTNNHLNVIERLGFILWTHNPKAK